jgi:predicted benzoate:H+ symporter BenE
MIYFSLVGAVAPRPVVVVVVVIGVVVVWAEEGDSVDEEGPVVVPFLSSANL